VPAGPHLGAPGGDGYAGGAGDRLRRLGVVPGVFVPASAAAFAVLGVCLAGLGWAVWASRARSPRAAWLVCGVVAFALLFEIGQNMLPAWADRRTPLALAAELEALRRDSRVGVACFGDEWGSIAFRLDRDGRYLGGAGRSGAEVTEFLKGHERNLLLVRPEMDQAQVLALVPAGMKVRLVLESVRGRAFLVQAALSEDRGSRIEDRGSQRPRGVSPFFAILHPRSSIFRERRWGGLARRPSEQP